MNNSNSHNKMFIICNPLSSLKPFKASRIRACEEWDEALLCLQSRRQVAQNLLWRGVTSCESVYSCRCSHNENISVVFQCFVNIHCFMKQSILFVNNSGIYVILAYLPDVNITYTISELKRNILMEYTLMWSLSHNMK